MNPLIIILPVIFGVGYLAYKPKLLFAKGTQVVFRGVTYAFDGSVWLPLGSQGLEASRINEEGEIVQLMVNGISTMVLWTGEAWKPI
jgi:hypothetical protein